MYYLNFLSEKFISIDIIAKDLVTTRDSANSRSLVMKLVVKKTKQDKGTSMLFLGDLENEGSGTPVNSGAFCQFPFQCAKYHNQS